MRLFAVLFSAIILLLGLHASPVAATLINPSFESQHDALMPNGTFTGRFEEWGMPDNWDWRRSGATNAHGMREDFVGTGNQQHWSSDGDWAIYLFASTAGSHVAGDYIEFFQEVDLAAVAFLIFDAMLKGGTYTDSYLAVDGQKLWTANATGTYLNTRIDLSDFTGVHEIQLGVEVQHAFGRNADGWTYFDNLRPIPAPASLALLLLGLVALGMRPVRNHAESNDLIP